MTNNQAKNKDLIVGLDIGTSKVVCLVGSYDSSENLEILSLGTYPSSGLKKGVVVNIDATTDAINKAVEQAQSLVDEKIKNIFVGIAGNHVKSLNSEGVVGIKEKEVKQSDVDAVIESARAVAVPSDQTMLHVIPQEYTIDEQDSIKEPIGMTGVRLKSNVHLVTCASNAISNIEKCISSCDLNANAFVLEQLASSYSILTEDEKDLGVCLVDIGGGTTDIAIFSEGAIRHTAVIPIAGDQVTNDIAMALRTPTPNAEEIKIKYACALGSLAQENETIKIPSVGDRSDRDLSRQALAEVVEPRYEELFSLVQAELRRSGFEDLVAAGIVLTGGTSKIEGAIELAEEIFHMPVSLGKPKNVAGLSDIVRNPIYSTAVGLLHYGANQQTRGVAKKPKQKSDGLINQFKKWFTGN